MRNFLLGAAVMACGYASAAAQAEPVDPHVLSIDIGRSGVMLSQIEDYRPSADREGETLEQERARQAAELREQVWRYNGERSRLCREGAITHVSCGAPYQPRWLNEARNAAPSLETLQTRSREVAERVNPLWGEACEEMRAHPERRRSVDEGPDPFICPME